MPCGIPWLCIRHSISPWNSSLAETQGRQIHIKSKILFQYKPTTAASLMEVVHYNEPCCQIAGWSPWGMVPCQGLKCWSLLLQIRTSATSIAMLALVRLWVWFLATSAVQLNVIKVSFRAGVHRNFQVIYVVLELGIWICEYILVFLHFVQCHQ